MHPDIQNIAGEREIECRDRADFFESRLRIFSKANWITVLVPSLLGVVAGSAIVSDGNSTWLGVAALIAAVLTAVHKGLNCDEHQKECRRLIQEYSSLEVKYRTLRQVERTDAVADFLVLEESLAELRKSQETSVKSTPLFCRFWVPFLNTVARGEDGVLAAGSGNVVGRPDKAVFCLEGRWNRLPV